MNKAIYSELWGYKDESFTTQLVHKKTASLSRISFDVLVFIGANRNTSIAKINTDDYFMEDSLSTIKRVVTELIKLNLITVKVNKKDAREKLLCARSF